MRCFVITRKHIIILICAILGIIFTTVFLKSLSTPSVAPAFKNAQPHKMVSDILPTDTDPLLVDEAKEYISTAADKTPMELLSGFGVIFPKPKPTPKSTHSPKPKPTAAPSQIPMEEQTNSSSDMIKNETPYQITENDFRSEKINVTSNPQILIIHTHTTESYTPEEPGGLPDNGRSTDDTKNMIAIGKIIQNELSNMGYTVIHDTTVHDYPSYQGAYGRSLATAKKQLSQNKNIQVILDIHRDAITKNDGTRVKLTKQINGTKCAQMMIVCGTDSSGLSHSGWMDNLNFAIKIQQNMNKAYPGLMRPINLREERFNQHLTPASLILEIGTHGNTLTEAKNGAAILARAIGEVLTIT